MRAPKNSPQDYQERDARIRQMHEAGVSNKEIVLAVGISREAAPGLQEVRGREGGKRKEHQTASGISVDC
jgi:hypothetical protein